ncbi:MAG: ABC transporter ATP-binding protein [Bryobacteraceae bacterium]
MSCHLSLTSVTAGYNATPVLTGFSLEVFPGELVALVGSSGCGKTTILKLMAGLLPLQKGEVRMDGLSVNHVPVEQRRAAMVFQKALLFPHLSVSENVGFSLKMKKTGAAEMAHRVEEALAEVKLEGFGGRKPGELSGGQEQRVALARALVSDPKILLLDEPFSALDENLRQEMRLLLKSIHRRLGLTTVFVTHDQEEASAIAHRIAFVRNGALEQVGPPRDFFTAPATLAAARFFGWQVLEASGGSATVFRPEAVQLRKGGTSTVEASTDFGVRARTTIGWNGSTTVQVEHEPPAFHEGDCVTLEIPPSARIVVKE